MSDYVVGGTYLREGFPYLWSCHCDHRSNLCIVSMLYKKKGSSSKHQREVTLWGPKDYDDLCAVDSPVFHHTRNGWDFSYCNPTILANKDIIMSRNHTGIYTLGRKLRVVRWIQCL